MGIKIRRIKFIGGSLNNKILTLKDPLDPTFLVLVTPPDDDSGLLEGSVLVKEPQMVDEYKLVYDEDDWVQRYMLVRRYAYKPPT